MREGLRARQTKASLSPSAPWSVSPPTTSVKPARSPYPGWRPGLAARIAVVGSGPAGLTMAADMAAKGHSVTVYEALPQAPAACSSTASPSSACRRPSSRRRSATCDAWACASSSTVVVGKLYGLTICSSRASTPSIVATGAGLPGFMGLPGENLCNVVFRQRVSHARQPDEGLSLPRLRHAGAPRRRRWRSSVAATSPWIARARRCAWARAR